MIVTENQSLSLLLSKHHSYILAVLSSYNGRKWIVQALIARVKSSDGGTLKMVVPYKQREMSYKYARI